MIDRLLSFVAPHYCCGCGKIGTILCDNCKNNISEEWYTGCIGCGQATGVEGVCMRCRLPYQQAWVVAEYDSPVGGAIKAMKFDGARAALAPLGNLLARRLPNLPPEVRLVPLPTIAAHRRQRGFDHTEQLVAKLSRQIDRPVARALIRRGNSVQHGATRKQRLAQAKLAFGAKEALDPQAIYLLVDDVVTTGASMVAAATALREEGAEQVWALSLTRQTLDEDAAI